MRKGNDGSVVEFEALADARRQILEPEQPARRETPNGEDEPWPQDPELPLAPERAQLLLGRGRRAVTAARRRASGKAARDRRAVEGLVELGLVHLEPAPERLSRASAPRPPLLALDDSGRLPEDVGTLSRVTLEHRPGFEWVAGLDAGTADTVVALERSERAVGATPSRQPRTTRNQSPSNTTVPF